MIIYLISGPRNCSTALMYSFSQRPDTTAIDEPFYGLWLTQLNEPQPFFDEIVQSMECNDQNKIHDLIEAKEKIKGNVFVKNMANTVKYMNSLRILNYHPLFLIRDPIDTIISHAKIYPKVTAEDLCLEYQIELYDRLKTMLKEDPPIIDGNELRKNPLSVLTQVCRQLNLPFTHEMLSWPSGPNPADGIWSEAWYKDVHSSTGFIPLPSIRKTKADIPNELVPIYDQAVPLYQKLFSHSIRA
ncbi:unnamed protein product [Adineta ricciae]|uniref:Sulfotransferase family protein n=1 Tax=Adineta ricciae TaxID=249248 RepID=A0A814RZZ3_ADIRI|nr:unnamed protein product [Adineta ricciae]CAF1153567.1 unnamed protein product [Adineta ricciae]